MEAEFEKLAYDAALRGLDKQEGVLEELRTRAGVVLGASSLAISFLGEQALRHPHPRGLAIIALVAFVVSMTASVFVSLPKKDLIFALAGGRLYEEFYSLRRDLAEVLRRLVYHLHAFWKSNDVELRWITRAFNVAVIALVVETLSLVALLGGTLS